MRAIYSLPFIALALCILSAQTSAITTANEGVIRRARIRYNGESCTKSVQCFSYNCEKAYCRPKKDVGTACYKDANCITGFCGSDGTCATAQASSSAAGSSTTSSLATAAPATSVVTTTVTATTTISTTTTVTTTTTASPSSSTPPTTSGDNDGTSDGQDGDDDDDDDGGLGPPVIVGSDGPSTSIPIIDSDTLKAVQSAAGFTSIPSFTSVFNVLPGGFNINSLLNNIAQKMKDTVSSTEKTKIQQDQDAKRSAADTKADQLARQQEIEQLQSLTDLLNSNPIAGLKLLGKY